MQVARNTPSIFLLIALLCLPWAAGCGGSSARFTQNKVSTRVAEASGGVDDGMSRELYQQITDILAAVFGTPDEPALVAGGAETGFIDIGNLVRAAGPVSSGRFSSDATDVDLSQGQGLYRQHCVHCHGVTGDGKGPTAAFLKPYPRDFTKGQFKFKSTRIGVPPTDDDLHTILMNGINGTAMPSFALLDRGEVNALVDYVKYLALRGQTERMLVTLAASEYAGEDDETIPIDPATILGAASDPDESEGVVGIINSWKNAAPEVDPTEPNVPVVSENPAGWSDEQKQELFASIDRGRKLYYTDKANCFSCHGLTQLGDGNLALYDDWTKELYPWATEKTDEQVADFLALGGLEPRIIRPRNLRLGQYRGGRRPLDIFWRIHNGIDGSGMPATGTTLTHDEIWDIVNFVLWLPYEQISHPNVDVQTFDRARD